MIIFDGLIGLCLQFVLNLKIIMQSYQQQEYSNSKGSNYKPAHNLYDELQSEHIQWKNQQIQLNNSIRSFENDISLENIGSLNILAQDQNKQNIENQDKKQQIYSQQNKCETLQLSQPKICSVQTITLIGQSIMSRTGNSSKDSHGQTSNLKLFLTNNQNYYLIHIKQMMNIYQKIKEYSEKSIENTKMYLQFFKSKYNQQLAYYEESISSSKDINIQRNQTYNMVFINSKLALSQVLQLHQQQTKKSSSFLKVLKFCKEALQNLYKNNHQSRQKQQKALQLHFKKTISLSEQIETIILARLHKNQNKDRYLEAKRLIEKQKSYIYAIYQLNRKVVKYVNLILMQQQLNGCTTIGDCLIQYSQAYQKCYSKTQFSIQIQNLAKSDMEKNVMSQLSQLLEIALPGNYKNQFQYQSKNKLTQRLISFNKDLQDNIYLPVIEMQDSFTLFKSGIRWTPYGVSKKQSIKLELIVTIDGYIILQQNDDVISMKISEIKISQKGKAIILIDKGKGVLGYIMTGKQLGKVQFTNDMDLQLFVNGIHTVSRKI